MIGFIKSAVREFRHVVWPTRKETQKYFSITLVLLIIFGLYLFVASNIFSELVFGLKDIFGTGEGSSISSSLTDEEIDALFSDEVRIDEVGTGSGVNEIEITEASLTGEIAQ